MNNLPMDTLAITPNTMKATEGGIQGAITLPAAIKPAERGTSYPALRIIGIRILPSAAASAAASPIGGMTTCDKAALDSSVQAAAVALGPDNVFTIDNVECASGWAVVTGILGAADAPADGPQGAPTSLIFEAEGQFWIPKAVADVCGTASGSDVPADALIPADLYQSGCLAG